MDTDVFFSRVNETWWELHLSEALDWRRNVVSINQYMKLLPDAFIAGVWHIKDVAWRLPTVRKILVKDETEKVHKTDKKLTLFLWDRHK